MVEKRNILLFLEFDGTNYAGWQFQPNKPTLQGVVEEAVKKVIGEEVRVTGSSRTDAGVHALHFGVNFLSATKLPLLNIRNGINFVLPDDVAVIEARDVPSDFDARKAAKSKTYVYRVFDKGYTTPLDRMRSWSVYYNLDLALMQKGADLLVGKKDFASFMATDSDAEHSVREILSFTVRRATDGFIELEVKGTAFLRHMVRIMAGTLVTLGRGKITLDDLRSIIEAKDRTRAPMTAPPEGLFLKEVEY